MSDSWLQRLVVRGPAADVAAFRRAARSATPTQYVTVRPQVRTQVLSFVALRRLLPPTLARTIDDPEEPWDLVVDPARRFGDGTVEATYKFQLEAFDCDDLVAGVSALYPRLCFVLGCVAPSNDQQSSLLLHRGRRWSWNLPLRRKNAIWTAVPEETKDNADEVTWALAEADWAMMDEVVGHWERKVSQVMAGIVTVSPARSRPARPRKRPKK